MSDTATKCWPWTHDWSKWKIEDGVAINKLTGNTRDALVQHRHCNKCGYMQLESVRGR